MIGKSVSEIKVYQSRKEYKRARKSDSFFEFFAEFWFDYILLLVQCCRDVHKYHYAFHYFCSSISFFKLVN